MHMYMHREKGDNVLEPSGAQLNSWFPRLWTWCCSGITRKKILENKAECG